MTVYVMLSGFQMDGPFTVTARPSPNAYILVLPPADALQSTVNVD
jgi:hypothetical protein